MIAMSISPLNAVLLWFASGVVFLISLIIYMVVVRKLELKRVCAFSDCDREATVLRSPELCPDDEWHWVCVEHDDYLDMMRDREMGL